MNKMNPNQISMKFMLIKFKELLLSQRRAILKTLLMMVFLSPCALLAQDSLRKVHPQYLVSSQSFKSKVGQNRVLEFNALESTLTTFISSVDPKPEYDYFIGDFQISITELVTLLGQPDTKISNGIWVYTLNPISGCKVLVGIDPNGYLSYVTRKECN